MKKVYIKPNMRNKNVIINNILAASVPGDNMGSGSNSDIEIPGGGISDGSQEADSKGYRSNSLWDDEDQ